MAASLGSPLPRHMSFDDPEEDDVGDSEQTRSEALEWFVRTSTKVWLSVPTLSRLQARKTRASLPHSCHREPRVDP